jgi:hypothetical protein
MGMLASKMNSSFIQLIENYLRAHWLYLEIRNVSLDTSMFVYTNNMNEYSFIWNHVAPMIRQNLYQIPI